VSIKYIIKAMEAKVGSSARKLVLIKLSDNANDDGVCFPSYQNISAHCEMSRRSVINHIKKLENDGFLVKCNRKTMTGNTSNSYQLIIKNSAEFAPNPSENFALGGAGISPTPSAGISPPSENFAPGGAGVSPTPSANFAPPSANFAPRTCHLTSHSFEPVTEPKEREGEKPKRTVFRPPMNNAVEEFAKNENLNLSGFFDYYESNGWMVGKNKMKNWKAAAKGWSRRQSTYQSTTRGQDECFGEEYWNAVERA